MEYKSLQTMFNKTHMYERQQGKQTNKQMPPITSLAIMEMQMKTTLRFHFYTSQSDSDQ